MSGSTGSARCYVRPPLRVALIHYIILMCLECVCLYVCFCVFNVMCVCEYLYIILSICLLLWVQ